MHVSLTTPALLFPAISLLLLAYTNRFFALAALIRNLSNGETVQGTPALTYGDYAKSYVHFKNLPKIVSDLEQLKKQQL